MKTKQLIFLLTVGITAGIIFIFSFWGETTRKYVPREIKQNKGIKGAQEWLARRINNQITNTVIVADVERARKQIMANRLLKNKASLNLEWEELGPDNIGGRTRAILIDNENHDLMFAGGVAGGLFKSTTGGVSWRKILYTKDENSDFTNLAINSIVQAPNGDIYFGTGEGWHWNHGANHSTPMILGQGIWKSTDHGQTFSRLTSTWDTEENKEIFKLVYKLAADPANSQKIYAATAKGLRVTNNGGTTWESVPIFDPLLYNNKTATDVKVASDGSVIASILNCVFIMRAGEDTQLELRSGSESAGLISSSGIGRLEFAFSPSNPNYVYCSAAKSSSDPTINGTIKNIYQSKDKGNTWKIIGQGGADNFNVFRTQGIYDNVITVSPGNPNEVFLGGINLWYGIGIEGSELFQWEQMSQWNLSPMHPLYIHADLHAIVFHPNDSLMFIGSDGGVARIKPYVGFQAVNSGYNVTQFYSVAYAGTGEVIGGTQDNGTLYIDYQGNTTQNAVEVTGGDGGYALISKLNPDVLFATSQWGRLQRSLDRGNEFQYFYGGVLISRTGFNITTGAGFDDTKATFVTPIALWETRNDPLSTDTIYFIASRNYYKGEVARFDSENAYEQPIWFTIPETENHNDSLSYYDGDTIKIHDPYQSIFALGLAKQVWITRGATSQQSPVATWDWWPLFSRYLLDAGTTTNPEIVVTLEFSDDGNYLYFATNQNRVFRSNNIQLGRDYLSGGAYLDDKFAIPNPDQVCETKLIKSFSQTVTGLAVDPNDPDKVIVTLGNYGNDNYIFYSDNASGQVSGTTTTFTSKQGDLPAMPVYSSVFHYNSDTVILATEYGIFATTNIDDASPTWTEENSGMENVPTFMIRQQTWENWRIHVDNHGYMYIGTHGRGIYSCKTLKGPDVAPGISDRAKPKTNTLQLNVYPNPVDDDAWLTFNLSETSDVSIRVYNIQGKLIKTKTLKNQTIGKQTIKFDISNLNTGTYLIFVIAGDKKSTYKILKY
ncbi:MAG: T9SS type A sorting domain-containing protein [Bacteroidales bacterium]|nr:T9SS type A sorting domain-containing protein [Bacteroidales bacterium]